MRKITRQALLAKVSDDTGSGASGHSSKGYSDSVENQQPSVAARDFAQVSKPGCFVWTIIFALLAYLLLTIIGMAAYDLIKDWI
jgi:hypothetical protein